jgi:hypothetical protein
MKLKGGSRFGEPRWKLGSKIVFFIVFFHSFLKLRLCKNGKKKLWLKTLLKALTIRFFSASIVDTVGFVNPHKVVA